MWVTAENVYNERVSGMENQIIARLRDRLDMACKANVICRISYAFLTVRAFFACCDLSA